MDHAIAVHPATPRRRRGTLRKALGVALCASGGVLLLAQKGALGDLFPDLIPDVSSAAFAGWVDRMMLGASAFAQEIQLAWTSVAAWWSGHYQRVPTLMLGLALVLPLPLLALLAGFCRHFLAPALDPGRTRRLRRGQHGGNDVPNQVDRSTDNAAPPWPQQAWVEVSGRSERLAMAKEVMQIGRDGDTDVVLHDPTVHRYHAAIHRNEDGTFMISDLAAPYGNGVYVNGHRVTSAPLSSGDRIVVGRRELRFHAQPL